MTLRKKVASALSFAHLTGIGSQSRAADDAPEKKDDGKAKKAKKAEDDEPEKKDQDREDGNVKKAKSGDDDDDDKDNASDDGSDADDEDEDDGDEKKAKAKGAKADDEDGDDEMSGNSAAAAARRRERARCAAIFGSKAAAKNPALAANLAFNTRMTRSEALVVLENSPAAAASDHSGRSARNPSLGGGGTAQVSSGQAIATGWDAAFKATAPRRR